MQGKYQKIKPNTPATHHQFPLTGQNTCRCFDRHSGFTPLFATRHSAIKKASCTRAGRYFFPPRWQNTLVRCHPVILMRPNTPADAARYLRLPKSKIFPPEGQNEGATRFRTAAKPCRTRATRFRFPPEGQNEGAIRFSFCRKGKTGMQQRLLLR